MKQIIVGDIHGKTVWKDIINQEKTFDKFIFIGDYVDSFDGIDGNTQAENLADIIQFKKDNPNKVILLIGNHDYHYIMDDINYSGYQYDMQFVYKQMYENNKELFKICHKINDNNIAVHAGITKTWLKNNGYVGGNDVVEDVVDFVNDQYIYKPLSFKFTIGNTFSPCGDDICQTPIWVRPRSLALDKVDNFNLVIGHSIEDKIYIDGDIIQIDVLHKVSEYLIFDNDVIKVGKIK